MGSSSARSSASGPLAINHAGSGCRASSGSPKRTRPSSTSRPGVMSAGRSTGSRTTGSSGMAHERPSVRLRSASPRSGVTRMFDVRRAHRARVTPSTMRGVNAFAMNDVLAMSRPFGNLARRACRCQTPNWTSITAQRTRVRSDGDETRRSEGYSAAPRRRLRSQAAAPLLLVAQSRSSGTTRNPGRAAAPAQVGRLGRRGAVVSLRARSARSWRRRGSGAGSASEACRRAHRPRRVPRSRTATRSSCAGSPAATSFPHRRSSG